MSPANGPPTTAPPEPALGQWRHSHAFGQDRRRPGESRTLIVIAMTGLMMIVEIVAGLVYGSMALLADGLHMASHTVALGINAFAYVYARRHAHDERYSFGTGKVNTLGGFTGAVLLAGFAVLMAAESLARFVAPVPIAYDHAILVAVLGLAVNGVCALVLGTSHSHDAAGGRHHHAHDEDHGHGPARHQDHNLVSAYLHVLADALTSLLAIVALLAAKYFGWNWADPAMGLIGALLVARWSLGLLRDTTLILLDRQSPSPIRQAIRASIERHDDNRVVDLHVWAVGPEVYCALLSIVTRTPQPPDHYKRLLPHDITLDHITVEVHPYGDPHLLDEHHHH